MMPLPTTTRPNRRMRFQIRDILALVVGYGLAALFFRAFWPSGGPPSWLIAPAMALYAWMGLALSGPVILLRRGSRQPEAVRRQGNTSACTPPRAITQTSRSTSRGAIDTGSHLSGGISASIMPPS